MKISDMHPEYPVGGAMKRTIILVIFSVSMIFWNGFTQGIVVDHTCTDISQIPQTYIDAAKSTLRIGYSHTSHGSQLVTGINAFKGNPGDPYYFESEDWGLNPGVFLNDEWANPAGAGDLGYDSDLAWRDATIAMLAEPGNDRNVVIWSWCGGVSDNTESGIDTYLNAMNALEQAYPGVRFVYMTGHLDGSGLNGNLHQMNERIRNYCRTHGKVLFDFADIESYDPNGVTNFNELYATDGCEYDTNGDHNPWGDGNWANEWMSANPSSELTQIAGTCSECAHSVTLNCVLKGRAFWWLMAKLAGWESQSSQVAIDSLTVDVPLGTAPLAVGLICLAHAPDGGKIVKYQWEITGPRTDSIVTTTGNLAYHFIFPGDYSVSVTVTDDAGQTATAILDTGSGDGNIRASGYAQMKIPLPGKIQLQQTTKDSTATVQTTAVNEYDETVSVTLDAKDASGQVLGSAAISVPANGSAIFSSDSFSELSYDSIEATADRDLLLYTRIETNTAHMTAELSTWLQNPLYVPHIAEETDYWDTYAYLSNTSPETLDITVAWQTESRTVRSTESIDLEAMLPENVTVADAWGKLSANSSDPFSASETLCGFEMFVKNGSDGAACELVGEGSTTLYIPHVPEETDIFWTGFAILNAGAAQAIATVTFYDDDGEVVGTEALTIPARTKIKGLMTDLFPDETEIARWGVIESSREINGIEIYGTFHAGICGMVLPAVANTWGILPDVLTGDGLWTGMAITNVSSTTATVTIRLVSANGTVKSGKTETIVAFHRFKAVVADYFTTAVIEPGDTVRYSSDQPVIALEASGDLDRTFMTALTGSR